MLITLGIIGVVAAMTLPTLIQKNQEKVTITKLKKMYSILSQAYLYAVEDNGTPDLWGFGNRDAGAEEDDDMDYEASNAQILKNKLFSQVKNIKICDKGLKKSECGLADHYYYANGSVATELDSKVSSLSMIDGSGIIILVNSGDCTEARGTGKYLTNICGWIFIDVNGKNAPNTLGRDLFGFYLTKNGIIPSGTQDETTYSFTHSTGHGRTAWIIFNENMDYLRCPDDLSWDGRSSCK